MRLSNEYALIRRSATNKMSHFANNPKDVLLLAFYHRATPVLSRSHGPSCVHPARRPGCVLGPSWMSGAARSGVQQLTGGASACDDERKEERPQRTRIHSCLRRSDIGWTKNGDEKPRQTATNRDTPVPAG